MNYDKHCTLIIEFFKCWYVTDNSTQVERVFCADKILKFTPIRIKLSFTSKIRRSR